MDLYDVACRYVLGEILTDDLPGIGAQALDAGFDSPSLRQLAGSRTDDPDEKRKLFHRSMSELHVTLPTGLDAGRTKALAVAAQVVRGAIAPYEGARIIWWDVYVKFPVLKELLPLVGLASEYEDDIRHRPEYETGIVTECEKLIQGSSVDRGRATQE